MKAGRTADLGGPSRHPARHQADRIEIEVLRADSVNEYTYDAELWGDLGSARQKVTDGDPKAADTICSSLLRGAVIEAWIAHVLWRNMIGLLSP